MTAVVAALSLAVAAVAQASRPDTDVSAGAPPREAVHRDPWFGADKLKHFFVAALTQSVAYSALQAGRVRHDRALGGAWAVTAAASLAKEFHDRRTSGLFSVRDLVWDAAGAGAASILLVRSQRHDTPGDPLPSPSAALVSRRATFAGAAGK